MVTLFKNATVYENGKMTKKDVVFDGITIRELTDAVSGGDITSQFDDVLILPGFCDVHVHFREPGFSYKETIKTGSMAAAHGGYTAVCAMPNLNPTPDTPEHLKVELDKIKEADGIAVYPYGTITMEEKGVELADMDGIAPDIIAFSDDGHGVQNDDMMMTAMKKAKSLHKIIAAHCEDNRLLNGGYIHDGQYAKAHGHKGICSESEWGQIARDVKLAEKTGCSYHVCHISTKESVQVIREAKARGVDVTCETGPHYLVLDDSNLIEDGRFKMNPPLRDKTDREALIAGVLDGTIDMIATDHAPHSKEEKSRGLEKSAMGITGLEASFPILYTKLVMTGVITIEKLVELMSVNPRRRFHIPSDVGFTVWDVKHAYTLDPETFLSMGKSTPFAGETVYGKCLMTIYGGKTVWQSK